MVKTTKLPPPNKKPPVKPLKVPIVYAAAEATAASPAKEAKDRSSLEGGAKRKRQSHNATPIWGAADAGDWIAVPRALIYIGAFDDPIAKKLEPRHLLLVLSLAAKKFKDKKTRRLWHYLATDLNVPRDTVRRWAYELERLGLLTIRRYKDKSSGIARSKPGYRNESNEFDLSPFVELVERAYAARAEAKQERERKRKKHQDEVGPKEGTP